MPVWLLGSRPRPYRSGTTLTLWVCKVRVPIPIPLPNPPHDTTHRGEGADALSISKKWGGKGRGRLESLIENHSTLGRSLQSLQDHTQNSIHILHDLIIPKTQHPVAGSSEICGSFHIIFSLVDMTAAIHFDDQFHIGRAKIHNIGADRVLPAEMNARQPVRPES